MKLRLIIDLSHNDGDGMHTNSRVSKVVEIPHGATGTMILQELEDVSNDLRSAFEDQVDQLVALKEVAP